MKTGGKEKENIGKLCYVVDHGIRHIISKTFTVIWFRKCDYIYSTSQAWFYCPQLYTCEGPHYSFPSQLQVPDGSRHYMAIMHLMNSFRTGMGLFTILSQHVCNSLGLILANVLPKSLPLCNCLYRSGTGPGRSWRVGWKSFRTVWLSVHWCTKKADNQ